MTTAKIVGTVNSIAVTDNSQVRVIKVNGTSVNIASTQSVALVQSVQNRTVVVSSGIQGPTGASGGGSGNSFFPSGW